MAEREWQPVKGWTGAGEYPALPIRCPRCGSMSARRDMYKTVGDKMVIPNECERCGLTFRVIANPEPLAEGCYDTEAIIEVKQSDINE